MKRSEAVCRIPLLGLLFAIFAVECQNRICTAGEQGQASAAIFSLEEISAFELAEQWPQCARGHAGECGYEPEADIDTYPTFTSAKPIYGSVRFAGEYGDTRSGTRYHFAIDESQGTGQGYDRLYFDHNLDGNLQNDAPLAALNDPPEGAMVGYVDVDRQVCFDYLDVPFDFDRNGTRPLEIMPRLTISENGYASLRFVTTVAHKGEIEIAGRQYDAFLGHNFVIGGWFDHPSTALCLVPQAKPRRQTQWWGADQLIVIHVIDGRHYRFSATPAGDKLTVQPYEGEFGSFKIGSGWRLARKLRVVGSLRSTDAALAVGRQSEDGELAESNNCALPVGDYLPSYLTVWLGSTRIDVSDNYHSDGKGRDRGGRPQVYGIKIRQNRPFVLDFSNEPAVMFASPAANQRIKLGDALSVKAVLTDPKLDIMIRDLKAKPISGTPQVLGIPAVIALAGLACLWMLSRRLRVRRGLWLSVAAVSAVAAVIVTTGAYLVLVDVVNARLEYGDIVPQVVVRRADGREVASGQMPFG
ncbi:MAG: hypothetical protein JSU70_19515 [Phycisphaerales bacterium]|nr:MAG: hypothetical protein JSU70_19515 [Phycisphaerales bacterium]